MCCYSALEAVFTWDGGPRYQKLQMCFGMSVYRTLGSALTDPVPGVCVNSSQLNIVNFHNISHLSGCSGCRNQVFVQESLLLFKGAGGEKEKAALPQMATDEN